MNTDRDKQLHKVLTEYSINEELSWQIARLRNAGSEAYNRAYVEYGDDGYKRTTEQMRLEEEIAQEVTEAIKHLIDQEVNKARLEENERYLEMLETGKWRSFGIEVTERIAQLTKEH